MGRLSSRVYCGCFLRFRRYGSGTSLPCTRLLLGECRAGSRAICRRRIEVLWRLGSKATLCFCGHHRVGKLHDADPKKYQLVLTVIDGKTLRTAAVAAPMEP